MSHVLIVDDDLLFSTCLTAALRDGGYIAQVTSPEAAVPRAACLAAVVNVAGPRGVEAVRALRRREGPSMPIVGYCGHKDAAQREAALAAGCDQVVPNAVIVRELPQLLTTLRQPRPRG